jgi:large subunit ribosomal protein L1
MAKKGKKYLAAEAKVDAAKRYEYLEACQLVKSIAFEKFDASVELAMNLNLDPKKAEQNLRGALVLPHGTGKEKRVLVFAKGEKAKDAIAAGADFVGDDDLIQKIQGGWFEFDVIIRHSRHDGSVGETRTRPRPKGLMPNPKTGTVIKTLPRRLPNPKGGKITYRVDKAGNIQVIVGKVSFTPENWQTTSKPSWI